MTLPVWAVSETDTDGVSKIVVDPAIVYPLYLQALGLEPSAPNVEIAMRCMVAQLHAIQGDGLHVKITEREAWKLVNLHPGTGTPMAHYTVFLERLTSVPGT